jgi:hypothetical protein
VLAGWPLTPSAPRLAGNSGEGGRLYGPSLAFALTGARAPAGERAARGVGGPDDTMSALHHEQKYFISGALIVAMLLLLRRLSTWGCGS